MENNGYYVRDAGDLRKYFTQMPNIIDDMDLSVYAYRLYGHLKRVAGDEGSCYQSTRTLADHCKMSPTTVARAKRELEDKGLISIVLKKGEHGGRDYHEITITDIWESNSSAYQVPDRNLQVPVVVFASTSGGIKEEPLKNNPLKNTTNRETAVSTPEPFSHLTEGQSLFLSAFGASRFKNKIQAEVVKNLEQVYGIVRLTELVEWSAKQGMSLGHALLAVESALTKPKTKPTPGARASPTPVPARPIVENEDGTFYG